MSSRGADPGPAGGRVRLRRLDAPTQRASRYLDGAGGAIVVNLGHGVAAVVDAIGEQLERTPYVHPHGVHDRSAGDVRRRARPVPSDGGRSHLPRVGRVRGRRDRAEDGADVPPREGRGGTFDGDRAPELVPREHPGSPRRLGEGAAPQALHAVAGKGPPRPGRLRVPMREPGAPARVRRLARRPSSTRRSRLRRGQVAAFIAEPVAGATLGAAVPPDDYWPAWSRFAAGTASCSSPTR